MKARKIWNLIAALSLTLMVSCQDLDLPGSQNAHLNPDQSSITPSPKGPKPLDGISLPRESTNLNPGAGKASSDLNHNQADTVPLAPMPEPENATAETQPGQPPTPTAGAATDNSQQNGQIQPIPSPTATPTADNSPSPEQQSSDYFYFSYDDSASTAGVEQTKYALKHGYAPNPSWVRPWEFLSAENFKSESPEDLGTFKVAMGLWQHSAAGQDNQLDYDLGVNVIGPTITNAERRNLVLTLVVDVSGSMENTSVQVKDGQVPTLLELVRHGLETLADQLKPGDVVNLVAFSTTADTRLDSFEYQGDKTAFLKAVDSLQGLNGTNLNAGLDLGYQLAQKDYDAQKINRVIMLTDAFANQGTVDPSIISRHTRINDLEGIYFSGLGFGYDFHEGFLNELTEAGKGTYFSVITQTDAERAFGERFMSLVNIAARNVRFRLDYPASLKRTVSNAEESSKNAEEVNPIHFSYNTSQYFLERFTANSESPLNDGKFKLTIEYSDPVTGEAKTEVLEKSLEEIRNQELGNIQDARMVTLFTALIRGEVSPEQARQEAQALMLAHSSSLTTEYGDYINTWLELKGY